MRLSGSYVLLDAKSSVVERLVSKSCGALLDHRFCVDGYSLVVMCAVSACRICVNSAMNVKR